MKDLDFKRLYDYIEVLDTLTSNNIQAQNIQANNLNIQNISTTDDIIEINSDNSSTQFIGIDFICSVARSSLYYDQTNKYFCLVDETGTKTIINSINLGYLIGSVPYMSTHGQLDSNINFTYDKLLNILSVPAIKTASIGSTSSINVYLDTDDNETTAKFQIFRGDGSNLIYFQENGLCYTYLTLLRCEGNFAIDLGYNQFQLIHSAGHDLLFIQYTLGREQFRLRDNLGNLMIEYDTDIVARGWRLFSSLETSGTDSGALCVDGGISCKKKIFCNSSLTSSGIVENGNIDMQANSIIGVKNIVSKNNNVMSIVLPPNPYYFQFLDNDGTTVLASLTGNGLGSSFFHHYSTLNATSYLNASLRSYSLGIEGKAFFNDEIHSPTINITSTQIEFTNNINGEYPLILENTNLVNPITSIIMKNANGTSNNDLKIQSNGGLEMYFGYNSFRNNAFYDWPFLKCTTSANNSYNIYLSPAWGGSSANLEYNTGTGEVTYFTSLRNHKLNLQKYDIPTKAIIMQLNIYKYLRKNSNEEEIGILADELEELTKRHIQGHSKYFCCYDVQNNLVSYKQNAITMLLLDYVKELTTEFEDFKSQTIKMIKLLEDENKKMKMNMFKMTTKINELVQFQQSLKEILSSKENLSIGDLLEDKK